MTYFLNGPFTLSRWNILGAAADLDAEDFKCELTTEDGALMKSLFLKLESAIGGW